MKNVKEYVQELSVEINGISLVIGKYEKSVDLARAMRLISENNANRVKFYIETIHNPKLIDTKLKKMVY